MESVIATTPAAVLTQLRVEGMTCNNCARHVTEASQSVPGVRSATISLTGKNAVIRWNSEPERNVAAVVAAIRQAGYEARELVVGSPGTNRPESVLARWQFNLWLGLGVTGVLMAGEWGFQLMEVAWFRWLSFALAGAVQVWCGAQFYRGAWRQLKVGSSNMDTLVALGSTTAFGLSCWVLLRGGPMDHLYFMEAAAIISLISLGHWLEARVSERASGALHSLLSLAPAVACRLQPARPPGAPKKLSARDLLNFKPAAPVPDIETEVPVADLVAGDLIVLKPGNRVPTDGTVTSGESAVDEAMLTGESLPVDKKTGDTLCAGTVNLNGRLVMRVTATGEATALARVIAAVERAQSSRAQIQRLADLVSGIFVPIIVVVAVAAALWWGLDFDAARRVHNLLAAYLWHAHLPATGWAGAFIVAASILIVACPCAMGLATPAAIMAGTNVAARRGFLIRDAVALEKAGSITVVVFDKTGTLTEGKPSVEQIASFPPTPAPDQSLLNLAAALAGNSTHPLSQAIARKTAGMVAPPLPELSGWQEIPGAGVQAMTPDSTGRNIVRLGSVQWLRESGVDLVAAEPMVAEWAATGTTAVGLAVGEELKGLFAIKDKVKPGAAKVMRELRRQGLKTYLLTGDNPRTAVSIAIQCGIPFENVVGGCRPEEKAIFIKQLQDKGGRVAFVGDGINDAPALTQANLGIVVSRASDIAREAADIILLRSELDAVPQALSLARGTLRVIRQNLFWAFFYNALGVPLAALGFVSPVWCAAAMGCSDLIVIGNALRLLRWK